MGSHLRVVVTGVENTLRRQRTRAEQLRQENLDAGWQTDSLVPGVFVSSPRPSSGPAVGQCSPPRASPPPEHHSINQFLSEHLCVAVW